MSTICNGNFGENSMSENDIFDMMTSYRRRWHRGSICQQMLHHSLISSVFLGLHSSPSRTAFWIIDFVRKCEQSQNRSISDFGPCCWSSRSLISNHDAGWRFRNYEIRCTVKSTLTAMPLLCRYWMAEVRGRITCATSFIERAAPDELLWIYSIRSSPGRYSMTIQVKLSGDSMTS